MPLIVTHSTQLADSLAAPIDLGQELLLGASGQTVKSVYETPGDLINILSNLILVVGGLIIFVTFIFAGYKFIMDDTKGKDEAKEIFRMAMIGLIVMFSAYWVTQIFGIIFGIDSIFNVGGG